MIMIYIVNALIYIELIDLFKFLDIQYFRNVDLLNSDKI